MQHDCHEPGAEAARLRSRRAASAPEKHARWFPAAILLLPVVLLLAGATLGACDSIQRVPRVTPVLSTPTATLLPSATPTQTATPTTTATPTPRPPAQLLATSTRIPCSDGMTPVLQLDPAGGDDPLPAVVPAGEIIRAGWRIQNTGGCVWDSAYSLQFSGPNNPGWLNFTPVRRLERSVRPGESMDVWIEAVAPGAGGVQTAAWELVNGRGERVGQPLTLTVETAAIPTQAGRPGRWFEAIPGSIQPGEWSALSWSVQDAKAVYLYGPGVSDSRYPQETTASRYVFPQRSTQYELHVVNGDDSIEKLIVRVEVEDYLEPRIKTFSVELSPDDQRCVEIGWTTENRVNRVLIYRNGDLIWDGRVDDAAIRDCPPSGRMVYILQIFGPGGSASRTRSIDVP